MDIITKILDLIFSISDIIWALLIPILLLTGLFFTLRTKFIQIGYFPEMIKALTNKKGSDDSISGLQAFFVGLASRVGTGNIAGVAIAISLGGAGAIFWMWIVALLGAASAFIESTLAQLYKVKDTETKFRGGPAYYISRGLNNYPLAVTFAVLISLAFGLIFNAVQANTIAISISSLFESGGPIAGFAPEFSQSVVTPLITFGETIITPISLFMAIILAVLVAIILFRGAKTIARVVTVIVPFMASLYILLALIIIIMNFEQIPVIFHMIFSEAFSAQALAGGLSGAVIQNGVKRGLFSNEAGMGSAPNAAASADVKHPITQGLIQSLGVFVDTIVVCSATAFIILSPGIPLSQIPETMEGIQITQAAIMITIGQIGVYFLTIAIFFFAFSSILGNYFYSQSNIEFI